MNELAICLVDRFRLSSFDSELLIDSSKRSYLFIEFCILSSAVIYEYLSVFVA